MCRNRFAWCVLSWPSTLWDSQTVMPAILRMKFQRAIIQEHDLALMISSTGNCQSTFTYSKSPNPFLPWSVWDSASTLQTLSLFNDAEQRVSSSLQTEWESQPLQSQGHLSRLNLRIATGISECTYTVIQSILRIILFGMWFCRLSTQAEIM